MGKYKKTSAKSSQFAGVKNQASRKRKPVKQKSAWYRAWFTKKKRPGNVFLLFFEAVGLAATGLFLIVLLVGSSAHYFAGTDVVTSLVPFLLSVFGVSVGIALCLVFWRRLRTKCNSRSPLLAPLLTVSLAVGAGLLTSHDQYNLAYTQMRIMVGGREEVYRVTMAHQVYAAYRRFDRAQLLELVKRSEPFSADIMAAASAFSLDPELLFGLAAAESSFYPRKSKDGGVGLFQITSVPGEVEEHVGELLGGITPAPGRHRYNAFKGAATLKRYLNQMGGDCLMGLLAYNIGPANGGLRFIMEKYKASDFMSIQPYLQPEPRRYPIRVLSYALAFRIWHQNRKFLTYEKGGNAVKIQKIVIPGLYGL